MTDKNEARFLINGTPAEDPVTGNRGYVAMPGETLEVTLEGTPSSVLSVLYEVFDSTDPQSPLSSKDAPPLTFVGSGTSEELLEDPTDVASIVMPASGAHSYLIRATASRPGGPDVFERMVVLETDSTTPAIRKTVPGETAEFEARGHSDTLNDMVDAIANSGGGGPGVDEEQVFYVGKHGNDSNDGKTIGEAFLTFGAAITAADDESPDSSNRFSIVCLDAGVYTENLHVWPYIHVSAGKARIDGEHVIDDNATLEVGRAYSDGTAFTKNSGTGRAIVRFGYLDVDGGVGATCTSGLLDLHGEHIYIRSGGIGLGGATSDGIHANVNSIEVSSGYAVSVTGGGFLSIVASRIHNNGATGFHVTDDSHIHAVVGNLNCSQWWYIFSGSLNLIVGKKNSSGYGSGGGTINVTEAGQQLLRAAGDFSSFPVKGLPVGADRLLIEDSADSGAKKYALVSSLPGGGGDSELPAGYLSGFQIQNNSGNPDDIVDISPGECRSDDDSEDVTSGSVITVDITSSGANGLDTGSVAGNTWYAVWIIWNPTSETAAGLFSTSFSSPTMPSGYTKKRRIGVVRTAILGTIRPFSRFFNGWDREYRWDESSESTVKVLSSGSSTSFVSVDLSDHVPPCSVYAVLNVRAWGYRGCVELRPSGSTIGDPVHRVYGGDGIFETSNSSSEVRVRTNGSQAIEYDVTTVFGLLCDIWATGFVDSI